MKQVYDSKNGEFRIYCGYNKLIGEFVRIGLANYDTDFTLKEFSEMGKAVLAFFQQRGSA